MIDMKKTGKQIHNLIILNGFTIGAISDYMGFSSNRSVYKWLSGQTLPSLDSLVLLSDLMKVPVDELIIRQ